ncbi:MAG: transporter, family, multidrug resistance protein [Novosphingobium sp.]|nr:transporter, family, multidrug resistance protein [Novosphingobium sp.]
MSASGNQELAPGQYPDPTRRLLITIPAMLASTMVAVDITIANVALPHMESSLSASSEQVVWVLTSYLIATAIATPLSGWLASRYGRKLVMLVSVAGFTIASALCGAANSLTMILLARALQGACGAALIPLSQAILLDINPPENHGKAMAIFAIGSMAGPIIGPTLGGWLTDSLSWRWVFFINIPFGIAAFFAMMAFLPRRQHRDPTRFDLFGFLALSSALAAFQLMMDRGEQLDWFESTEIWIYASIVALGVYLTIVHMFTARDTFVRPELFRDRNFAIGSVFSIMLGIVAFAMIPVLTVMMQNTLGYTALYTGFIGLPRAIGTLVSLLILPRFISKVDTRLVLFVGMAILAAGMLMYTQIDLYVDERALLWAGFVQGIGGGLIFLPLSVIVFATLPQTLRNEGAAMFSLTRNIGNAVGISLLQRELIHHTATSRAHLMEGLRPDNPILQMNRPDLDLSTTSSALGLSREVARQAAMVADVQVYQLVFVLSIAMIPLIIFLRVAKVRPGDPPLPVME